MDHLSLLDQQQITQPVFPETPQIETGNNQNQGGYGNTQPQAPTDQGGYDDQEEEQKTDEGYEQEEEVQQPAEPQPQTQPQTQPEQEEEGRDSKIGMKKY